MTNSVEVINFGREVREANQPRGLGEWVGVLFRPDVTLAKIRERTEREFKKISQDSQIPIGKILRLGHEVGLLRIKEGDFSTLPPFPIELAQLFNIGRARHLLDYPGRPQETNINIYSAPTEGKIDISQAEVIIIQNQVTQEVNYFGLANTDIFTGLTYSVGNLSQFGFGYNQADLGLGGGNLPQFSFQLPLRRGLISVGIARNQFVVTEVMARKAFWGAGHRGVVNTFRAAHPSEGAGWYNSLGFHEGFKIEETETKLNYQSSGGKKMFNITVPKQIQI